MSHPPQQALYHDISRSDVQPFIPSTARSALDVGCSRGGFGPTLRSALGPTARIVGVEAVAEQAAIARDGHGFDEVIEGYFPDAMAGRVEQFDLVCYNDVLEHLLDPWSVLVETRRYLAPGGHVLAAIPSIQFAPVLWRLVRGRWDYTDSGTLDRTHLRFFTRATMVEMFEQAGYRVERCVGANSLAGEWWRSRGDFVSSVKRLLLPAMGDLKFVHFVLVASVA